MTPIRRRDARAARIARCLLALCLAAGLGALPPSARDVAAATPDLTMVTDAHYTVQPDKSRVHVEVSLVAANHLHDTVTRRYYFDRAYLAVMPGTTSFRLTTAGAAASVSVSRRTRDYTLLLLQFGRRIYSGKSARYLLSFNLPDPGGAPTRDVRIGASLVSFPAWAFASASTPGSSVQVSFPSGYSIQIAAGSLPAPSNDAAGQTIYQSGPIADPLHFFVYFVADRQGSYAVTPLTTTIGTTTAQLTLRAWSDDPAWAKRVGQLVVRGLPVLSGLIGLPWTRGAPLEVQEAVSRTTGGYAGLFDPQAGRIEVAYYADAFVILHEAAHAWFNGSLLADRWANEAFASYYAGAAATKLKQKAAIDRLTPALEKARIPLNAWGAVGREDAATEDYAYAASVALATAIANRAGGALPGVWSAAADHEGAYQPPKGASGPAPVETVDVAPDWRGLLDLLEDKTAQSYDDLWRTWVVRDTEASLLDARRAARTEYTAVETAAGEWALPRSIRDALRAWQFEQAQDLLAKARGVLARRATLERLAAAAGLRLPDRLELAFEGDAGFDAATAEADAEATTISAIEAAGAQHPSDAGPLVDIGLIGETPDALLASARREFVAGDLAAAVRDAGDARGTWLRAEDVGRNRVLAGIGVALIALLGLAVLAARWHGRKRRRSVAGAYVTLPGDPVASVGSSPTPAGVVRDSRGEDVP